MIGYEASPAEVQAEIQKRQQMLSPTLGVIVSNDCGVICTDIDEQLFADGLDIDVRYEGVKEGEGWHIYLVAEFKKFDVRRMWHFDLRVGALNRQNHLLFLQGLVDSGGQWGVMQGKTGIVDLFKGKKAMGLPQIVELHGLKNILEQSNAAG